MTGKDLSINRRIPLKTKLLIFNVLVMGVLTTSPAPAHHSFAAEFDSDKPFELHGVVSNVVWTNPHSYFYIEVKNNEGGYDEWAMEMGSPNGLMRHGWTSDTLEVGTKVMVMGSQARDDSFKGNVQLVILTESCVRLFAGTSQRGYIEDETETPTTKCR